MAEIRDPDENATAQDQPEVPEVPAVFDRDDEQDSLGLPDEEFLGLDPGDANKETGPGDPPVPHGG